MDQKKNQGQRQSEQTSGQQGSQRDQTRGRGVPGERNRSDEGSRGGGISNRDMDRELDEQMELPDRGSSQRDRDRESER